MIIVHGGQTGADRGAHLGAMDAGHSIEGFCPRLAMDEFGPIPPDVLLWLTPHGSLAERTRANVDRCDLLLIVVPTWMLTRHHMSPGTRLTREYAEERHKPILLVNPDAEQESVQSWYDEHRLLTGTRLMVAGPRRTKWAGGEALARKIVGGLRG